MKRNAFHRRVATRPIDGEMLAADRFISDGVGHGAVEERLHQAVLMEALAVLGEAGVVEDLVVGLHVQKPAVEQVELDVFAELALGADGIQRLQERGHDQRLGRDGGLAQDGIGGVETVVEAAKFRKRQLLDHAQRVILANHGLEIDRVKQCLLSILVAAHRCS